MDWNKARVFISGGSGVIGRNLVRALLKKGADVFVGDLQPIPDEFVGQIQYRQGDLNTIEPYELQHFKPDYFFHLAATFERSVETIDFWHENFQHNVKLSNKLLDVLSQGGGLKKVIFASSYLIYDQNLYSSDEYRSVPSVLHESSPINPRNTCGGAKLLHELELDFLSHFEKYSFSTVSARIYRSFGTGSRDVVSRWARSAVRGEPISVFQPENSFDYIYAGDVAEGLVRLCENDAKGIYNLGSGKSSSVGAILNVFKEQFPDLKVSEENHRIKFEHSSACMKKFANLTGWTPSTSLYEGVKAVIEYEKENNGNGQYATQSDEHEAYNTLILSVNAKTSLIDSLKKALLKTGSHSKIIGVDSNAECLAKHFVDEFICVEQFQSFSFDRFLAFCVEHKINRVIPTRDGELEQVASWKERLLKHGILCDISGVDAVKTCLNKLSFYKFSKNADISAIETAENIEELSSGQSGLFVVKPKYGSGSTAIKIGVTSEEAKNHAAKLETPVFQPFIEGTEYSIDTYFYKGAWKAGIVRERVLVTNGESQVTTNVDDPTLLGLCKDLGAQLRLDGHAVFQAIKSKDGAYHMIECNPRFGGASSFSQFLGVESMYWQNCRANGADLDGFPVFIKEGQYSQIRKAHDNIFLNKN